MTESRLFRRGFAVASFTVVLAGDAFRYSITWYGWVALVLALTAIAVVILVKSKGSWSFRRLPSPLLAFVALAVISIAWSDYPGWSALGFLATAITIVVAAALAIAFTAREIIWALGTALRLILGLSLLFELVISTLVRQPILPWWTNYGHHTIHAAYYWSRDLLLTGGRIQGLVGNSNLLGFLGLIALIVFAVQLASKSVRVVPGVFWLLVAGTCVALTGSGTVTVATVIVVVAAVLLVLIRRAKTGRGRLVIYVVSLFVGVLGIVAAIALHATLLALLHKNSTFTGRTSIWNAVIGLAHQRPVFGWGWVSYWVPNVSPFDSPVFRLGGIQYLQAHEAWLDVWFQLGVVGLVVFGALVLTTLVRVWILAVAPEHLEGSNRAPFSAQTLLPVLVLVALLAQSLAESRLLIEYGMLLLCLFAIRSKRDLMEADAL